MKLSLFLLASLLTVQGVAQQKDNTNTKDIDKLKSIFFNHPAEAKPGVLWMWMGANLSKEGITKDLEELKKTGFNRTTMFSLADVTTPWAGEIGKSPTPELISWTAPWWKLVRHAALESKRLGMDFGMFNGPGYESSGGPWISPEYSMQEICWSTTEVEGNLKLKLKLERPMVDPRSNLLWPVYNPETGLVEKPVIPARKTYYKDIVVLAAPAKGVIKKEQIINLSSYLAEDGSLEWTPPSGNWSIYRIGHTTMGAIIQPAQWKATGLECDKMSAAAVGFHMDHVIGEIKKNIGDLIGDGFSHVHFDSYEAGTPTWTLKMAEEFRTRRGYDLQPFLLTFTGRTIESKTDSLKFRNDFDATIKDLYRDIYFKTVAEKLENAGLTFLCEPYGGPWRQEDIMPKIHKVMTEFWTNNGNYSPYELEPTVAALRKSGQKIIEAEAFTGLPNDSKWNETPAWLKPIGDAAFCAGVNRLILHRFTHQPWDNKYLPGATMGQWGTHFDRTQTWWDSFGAMVKYWSRCQALLQWGDIVDAQKDDFKANSITNGININMIHRRENDLDVYFVANLSRAKGSANCSFKVSGKKPQLWNPVTGTIRLLPQFNDDGKQTTIQLDFAEAQSFFIVFTSQIDTNSSTNEINFPIEKSSKTLINPWTVKFDPKWGGPKNPVTYHQLQDWTKSSDSGIKYFSGTAIYQTTFNFEHLSQNKSNTIQLDLGEVKHIAQISLNGKDLGIIWTAPWQVDIPTKLLKQKNNKLTIKVTNVWANRLIGDEQQPEDSQWLPGHQGGRFMKEFPDWFLNGTPRPSQGRYTFTTWNYFNKKSPLISSGLLGPVRILY